MLKAYFDGGMRNNGDAENGVAGCGWIIEGHQMDSFPLPQDCPYKTNNVAEYYALLKLLKYLNDQNIDEQITIYGDSQLVIKQVLGKWKCNQGHLIPLRDECKKLMNSNIQLVHVKREFNKVADKLSNIAMDFPNDSEKRQTEILMFSKTL